MRDSVRVGTGFASPSDQAPSVQGAVNGLLNPQSIFRNLITGGAYGDAVVQDATNKYNEWLYNTYQSPSAQKSQLESAGYNPNYYGASSAAPQASGAVSSGKMNPLPQMLNAANLLNGIIGAMSEGVGLVSQVAGVPLDIAAKKWKNMILEKQTNLTGSKADSAFWRAMYDSLYYGNYPLGEYIAPSGDTYNPSQSSAMVQANLRNEAMSLSNALRSYDLNNLKPEEKRKLIEQTKSLALSAGISSKALEYFDANTWMRLIGMFAGLFK